MCGTANAVANVNDRLNRATHDRRNGAIKKAQKRFQTAFSN
jgi:hypothetical protein